MAHIGERIRTLREAYGLTQQELGYRINRSQPDIYKWETGRVRVPADVLPALARALGIGINSFFDEMHPVDVMLQVEAQALPVEARKLLILFLQSLRARPG